ncbi:alpha/beta-hydrolase [Hyaloscypha variabilis F]|uniref:Alpha/beta-hydrolase n=1 Tax=Hyaloscypha variabilis (strain UAMH 11265 / GT02V1 / F) TaxID=1149755 RepID=A0A2J6QTY0_HYAVF|nr:alpha/beta-hydrolase [Hyaloscypha variabilis F]
MPSHQMHESSPGEKVKLCFVLVGLVIRSLLSFSIKLIPRLAAGWPLGRILVVSYMRSLSWLSFSQSRTITVPTGQAIQKFCQKAGLFCKSVDVPSSSGPQATLHYIQIADLPQPRLLLYFHGGGYCHPIDAFGQLPFALECAHAASASSLVCLEYTLAPELPYPGQLLQAVSAVSHILETHNPSQILLGGDSAGGHLLLSLLAHIQTPHPAAKPLSESVQGEKFLGAFAISPWVSMNYNSPSFAQNASRDYLRAERIMPFIEMWKPSLIEVWAELLVGDGEFWGDVKVERVLLTSGEWECFYDDIVEMAGKLKAREVGVGGKVELCVGEREVHIQCAVDMAVGARHGKSAREILAWLRRVGGEKRGVLEEV